MEAERLEECAGRVFVRADGMSLLVLRQFSLVVQLVLGLKMWTDPLGESRLNR